jgi:hypothetical protein
MTKIFFQKLIQEFLLLAKVKYGYKDRFKISELLNKKAPY